MRRDWEPCPLPASAPGWRTGSLWRNWKRGCLGTRRHCVPRFRSCLQPLKELPHCATPMRSKAALGRLSNDCFKNRVIIWVGWRKSIVPEAWRPTSILKETSRGASRCFTAVCTGFDPVDGVLDGIMDGIRPRRWMMDGVMPRRLTSRANSQSVRPVVPSVRLLAAAFLRWTSSVIIGSSRKAGEMARRRRKLPVEIPA